MMEIFWVLMCICWNCMEVEIRSFDCVNIILWQSGPIYAHPSAHHSATVVSWLPLSLPSPFWPQGLCTSLCPCTPHVTGFLSPFVPRKFPFCRQNLPGTYLKELPRHPHLHLSSFSNVWGTYHFLLFSCLLSASATRKWAPQEWSPICHGLPSI